jgi:hypothetical protein
MGCDTGFTPYDEPFYENIRAGCEHGDIEIDLASTVEDAKAYMKTVPRVFKACDWSWMLKGYLARGFVDIDHMILPFRDIDESARSRLDVGLDWMLDEQSWSHEAERWALQSAVHAMVLGRAIEVSYLYRIPLHVLRYPDFTRSAEYCYQRLSTIFDFDYEIFKTKHAELVRVGG